MRLLIKNGHVIDPDTGKDGNYDLLAEDGRILRVAEKIEEEADRTVDAAGLYVMPGLIDLHVHLRDPGLEYKETLHTGAMAAARGGVTTICAMPNTSPITDSPEMIRELNERAKKECPVHVSFIGAVTKGELGTELTDIAGMKREGTVLISEDGKSVMDAGLYREAMKIAAAEGVTVLAHCEDKNMVRGGVMNECEKSRQMGLPGITNGVEDVIVARDIVLAGETGAKLHLCHCSTKGSVEMVRLAKEAGIAVTAEVCPHHFILTAEDIPGDDGNYKMNPPLRNREDVEALREGLRTGVIDVISTDHAPHSAEEKARSITAAPSGIIGLETALSLGITELVRPGHLTLLQLLEKMTVNPAQLYHLPAGKIAEGEAADLVLFNPEEQWVPQEYASRSSNSPFTGRKLYGKVKLTLCSGEVIYADSDL